MRLIISNHTPTAIKIIGDDYIQTSLAGEEVVFSGDTDVTILDTNHEFVGDIERDGTKLRDTVYEINAEGEIITDTDGDPVIESKTEVSFT